MATTIIPPNYPNSNRTPVVAFQLDNSNANSSTANLRTLLIGQVLSGATATLNVPVLAYSTDTVNTLTGGASSMLANMYRTYLQDDGFAEIWLLPVADAGGATASVNTATVTGPATASGTLSLYIAGNLVSVAVSSGDSATVIGAAIVAAVGTIPNLPVTAAAALGVVTLTSVHKGVAASDVDLRLNYRGAINGEATPAGVSVAFLQTVVGATDPTLTTALGNLDAGGYAFIASPYSGSAQMTQMQAVLSDVNGTWSWLSNTGGGVFSAYKGTSYAAVQTYGATNNLQHTSVLGIVGSPTPVAQIAASYAATCANSLRVDPALPLTAIVMTGILAPPAQQRFTRLQRNVLLYDGISTQTVDHANEVILELAITTYQTNAAGAPDNSYLYVNTLYTLQAIISRWKIALASKYARVKLVNDATPIRPGTNTVNPASIKSEVIAQYVSAGEDGLVQDVPAFIKAVRVQMVSPNQVNCYAPVIIATGLYALVFDMAFTL